ncbi:MAG: NAD(P)/FAD-dependent oxidoreductase [Pseudomonadota bacterium]|nr:NAD(P)/FAD-dependent oxidoreductase [Pseudomonadota bacterium]
MHVEVIIVGAGAAGLMCAATAAARGKSTLVLDHANKAGKKILMSGGGKCNFTNYFIEPDNFLSSNPHFCKSALGRFTQWDFIALVERHGVVYHEKKHGQLFCGEDAKSKASARHILQLLLDECAQSGATIQLKTDIQAVKALEEGFSLSTSKGQYHCDSLVIATGGLSIPTLGASGFGYQLAEQFGLQVLPTRAALVPYYLNDKLRAEFESLSGVSVAAKVSCNDQSFVEDILFTHRGLSGPAVLQISSYWQLGDTVEVNLLPEIDLAQELKTLRESKGKSTFVSVLSQWLPKKLVQTFMQSFLPELAQKPLAECSNAHLMQVAEQFNRWLVKPPSTEGYRTAEVTLGGVCVDEVSSKSFESQRQPGLYFVGEVLDVTGWLGGFNFQWAWASGYCAGQSV